ncbi:uncharacterized protein LOC128867832 [Anastrepha ludens]|uniref:uncharacterized protein LOC128867832 n=1 Tax=Anastrepha ludens TaxID=28586 RepID=UPI0023B1B70C|nr:uncharacterized protein LOC128867832 [Anastrepha ludens]
MNTIVGAKRKKRLRKIPNKKWSEKEVDIILDYILQASVFELPSAQAYYRELIKQTGIDAEWNLLRWKVRNMRISLRKANDWLKSTECEQLDGPTKEYEIEKRVLSICPYYKKLTTIFGVEFSKRKAAKFSSCNDANENETAESEQSLSMIIDDPDSSSQNLSDSPIAIAQIEDFQVEQADVQTYKVEFDSVSHLELDEEKQLENSELIKKYKSENIKEFELRRYELEKIKLQFEKEKFEKEMQLQEKRLKLEEEKLKVEQRWQEKEFELKKLEIEKNERIAMYEIDKKYQNA